MAGEEIRQDTRTVEQIVDGMSLFDDNLMPVVFATFEIEGGGTVEKVWEMARYVVAFEQWTKDEQIAFVASHYDGFAQGKAGVLDSMGYPTQFYPHPGSITYLGITQDKDGYFRFVVAEGINEPGPIFTFGDTNMRMRFARGAREFCNTLQDEILLFDKNRRILILTKKEIFSLDQIIFHDIHIDQTVRKKRYAICRQIRV